MPLLVHIVNQPKAGIKFLKRYLIIHDIVLRIVEPPPYNTESGVGYRHYNQNLSQTIVKTMEDTCHYIVIQV